MHAPPVSSAAELFIPPTYEPPGDHDHLTPRWCAARERILKRPLWATPWVAEIVGEKLIPLEQVEPLAKKTLDDALALATKKQREVWN